MYQKPKCRFGTEIDHPEAKEGLRSSLFGPPRAGVGASILYGVPYDVAAAVAGPLGAHSSLLKLIKILLQPFTQPVLETSIFIKRCSLLAGGGGEVFRGNNEF